jgi:ribonuclease-3
MSPKSNETRVETDLAGLQAVLEHRFHRLDLLERALTHRSLANAQASELGIRPQELAIDNERLEFLGDAVIGLVVAEMLFQLHPDWTEGQLTVVRSQLVSRLHMAEVAGSIDLGIYLRLSKGEERGGLRQKTTVLSNTMEAVLGALYLDGGLEPVKGFVSRYVTGDLAGKLAEELRSGAALGNYKSALQEHLQAARAGIPVYRVKTESGPEHRKRFLVEVRLNPVDGQPGKPLARGMGSTKKLAEQDAARRALARLGVAADGIQAEPESGGGMDREADRRQ